VAVLPRLAERCRSTWRTDRTRSWPRPPFPRWSGASCPARIIPPAS